MGLVKYANRYIFAAGASNWQLAMDNWQEKASLA